MFEAPEGTQSDLFMVERADPAQALDEIVSLVSTRLPKHYDLDPLEDIQVFAPVYKGPLGIDALNARLRDAINPDGKPVLGGRLRLGDKLMLSGRNLHDLGLMNGTILRLIAVGDDSLTVTADGRHDRPARTRRRRACSSPTRAASTRARASSCRPRSSSRTPPPAPTSCAARCSTRR